MSSRVLTGADISARPVLLLGQGRPPSIAAPQRPAGLDHISNCLIRINYLPPLTITSISTPFCSVGIFPATLLRGMAAGCFG